MKILFVFSWHLFSNLIYPFLIVNHILVTLSFMLLTLIIVVWANARISAVTTIPIMNQQSSESYNDTKKKLNELWEIEYHPFKTFCSWSQNHDVSLISLRAVVFRLGPYTSSIRQVRILFGKDLRLIRFELKLYSKWMWNSEKESLSNIHDFSIVDSSN